MKKWLAILMAVAFASVSQGQNVIDSWDFDVLDGAIDTAGSYSDLGVGGKTWGASDVASIVSSNAVLEGLGNQEPSPYVNFFRSVTPSVRAGETSGKYQLSVDIVSANFANTSVSNQSATFGIGIRKTGGGGGDDQLMRFMYQGQLNVTNVNSSGVTNIIADADQIQITVDSKDITLGIVDFSIPGSSVSNLNFRQVYDLNAGTYEAYYTLGAASEVLLHSGAIKDGWDLGALRINSQQYNGGQIWEPGDLFKFDNIEFTQLVAPATTLYEGNLSIVDSQTGTFNKLLTNLTYKTFADAQVGDVVVVLTASNKGGEPDATDSTGVITFGGTASLTETNLKNRVAIGGAPSANWCATVTAAGSVDVNLSHVSDGYLSIGTYLVRSDSDEIEVVAMAANSATDPAAVTNLYDFGGMVDGQGLFFEATSGNDAAGWVASNTGTILDVGPGSRQIARGTFSEVSAITNIWTTATAGKRSGVAGIVLAGLGTSPTVTVDEWDMNSNGQYQRSNNDLVLPGTDTNAHQFAQTTDDGTFIYATTNVAPANGFSDKTTLSQPVVLTNAVAKMTLKFSEIDWSSATNLVSNFGIRLYDDSEANYVGLKIADQGATSDAIRISAEGNAAFTAHGRLSSVNAVTGDFFVTIELDYANSEIRLLSSGEWFPGGVAVQTNSFDFAALGITELTKIQTRSANWSTGDYIVLDNLEINYTPLDTPEPPDTPDSFYSEWLAENGYTSDTGLLEDANGNGVNNLTEYAIGGAANLPVESVDGAYLVYVHVQWDDAEASARGLSYAVLADDNLVFGDGFSTNDVEFVGSVDGVPEAGHMTVTNQVPTDIGARFMKLDITFTP
ncbi:hypothetical protein [Pontiella sulfatireligans]|nr:hypothetical protein [Pontiella sulfatireligans]